MRTKLTNGAASDCFPSGNAYGNTVLRGGNLPASRSRWHDTAALVRLSSNTIFTCEILKIRKLFVFPWMQR